MQFAFTSVGFAPPPDLPEFARTTALFEIWRPLHDWTRLAIDVARAPGAGARYRCRVSAEDEQSQRVGEAIGGNPFEAVQAAARALADRGRDPLRALPAVGAARPVPLQRSGGASVMQPCEAS